MKTFIIHTFAIIIASMNVNQLRAQENNKRFFMTEGNPFLEADQNHILFSVSPSVNKAVSKNILFTNNVSLPVYIDRVVFSNGLNTKFQIAGMQKGTIIESNQNMLCSITFNPSSNCTETDTLKVYFSNAKNPIKIVLSAKKELIVSPNPTNGQVTLQGSFYKAPLMVYDAANGNVVLETKVNGINPVVNLDNLPPRNYIFKMNCVTTSIIKN